MQEACQSPIDSVAAQTKAHAPGILSVIGKAFTAGSGLAVVGAVGGAALAGVSMIPGLEGMQAALSSITFNLGSGTGALFASGAVTGAASMGILGTAAGTVSGIHQINEYYEEQALPAVASVAHEQGRQAGAVAVFQQMSQQMNQAAEHTQHESQKWRQQVQADMAKAATAARGA